MTLPRTSRTLTVFPLNLNEYSFFWHKSYWWQRLSAQSLQRLLPSSCQNQGFLVVVAQFICGLGPHVTLLYRGAVVVEPSAIEERYRSLRSWRCELCICHTVRTKARYPRVIESFTDSLIATPFFNGVSISKQYQSFSLRGSIKFILIICRFLLYKMPLFFARLRVILGTGITEQPCRGRECSCRRR
jgi:hypothetical protein